MSSKIASSGLTQIDPNESDTSLFLPIYSSSHRTASFSSLSSLSSNSSLSSFRDESPVFSPKTPLQSTRIPFSWEKLPGIPIKKLSEKNDTSSNILPLPPARNQFSSRKLISREVLIKKYDGERFRNDPFFAALVECSKDHDRDQQYDPIVGKISKITRSLGDGFAIVSNSTSCKSNCAVFDSKVFVPRSRKHNIVLGHTTRNSKRSSRFNDAFY